MSTQCFGILLCISAEKIGLACHAALQMGWNSQQKRDRIIENHFEIQQNRIVFVEFLDLIHEKRACFVEERARFVGFCRRIYEFCAVFPAA